MTHARDLIAIRDANFVRGARKTSSAAFDAGNGYQHPIERTREQPETRVSVEGTNLLMDEKTSRSPGS